VFTWNGRRVSKSGNTNSRIAGVQPADHHRPKPDQIGIVTVHEGPTLPPGELIAPAVGTDKDQPNFHNNYQDIEAFSGRRRAAAASSIRR